MSKQVKKNSVKKTKKFKYKLRPQIIVGITLIILLLCSLHILGTITLFKNIETPFRVVVGLLLIDIAAIFTTVGIKLGKGKNYKALSIFSVILLLYSGVIGLTSTKVKSMYKSIAKISNQGEDNVVTYSTSIVVKSSSSIKDIDDVKKGTIGVVEEEDNVAGYQLPMQIMEEQKFDSKKLYTYDNPVELLQDLLDGEIDAAFLPSSYASMYASDDFDSLDTDTKIIYTETTDKVEKVEEKVQKDVDEPFTMLILGVDTTGDGIGSSFNGDALLLVTFNPKTMNSTILSIPRDSYMPISCFNGRKNKITNAGWQGEKCIIKTLENYFDIPIDYYYKINFNGLVDLVDAVGGVDVDVPYSFCEQNSARQWGKNTIFVKAGQQHLNGEQALAFARHRKTTAYMVNYCGSEYTQHANYWNDFIRGQNQQVVLRAILDKVADSKSFNTIENLLSTISKNSYTDMSVDTILSLYNVGKKILNNSESKNQMLNMQRLYLSGYDARIYDYSFIHNKGTKLTLYDYVIYDASYEAVKHAMKVNLELEKSTPVKTFSFSIHNPYEQTIIGKGVTSSKSLVLMENFVGKNIEEARAFATSHGVSVSIKEVTGTSGQFVGQIISQDIPEKTDLSMVNSITFTVVSEVEEIPEVEPEPEPETPDQTEPENPETPDTPQEPDDENTD